MDGAAVDVMTEGRRGRFFAERDGGKKSDPRGEWMAVEEGDVGDAMVRERERMESVTLFGERELPAIAAVVAGERTMSSLKGT